MKKIITILYCLLFSIIAHGVTYSPFNAVTQYNQTYPTIQNPSYKYEFKSTSSYKPIVQYQTVKPIDNNGFVSNEYMTSYKSYKPRNFRNGLDLDDDDEPNAGIVPIGEPIIPFLMFIFVYVIHKHIIHLMLK